MIQKQPAATPNPSVKYDIEFSVPFAHRVRFTQNLAASEFPILEELLHPSEASVAKVLLVVDQGWHRQSPHARAILDRIQTSNQLQLVGHQLESQGVYSIAGGEDCKNDSQAVNQVLGWINQFDIDRRSYVIVIGGGAVLDAVGYAAAIAHRGIRLIRIPTTTLAQGDSGVGVKNAINAFDKKNWIGTFAVPWAVINDATLLESLEDRDFCCGFSEAVKVSLLKSSSDFDFLCEQASRIRAREMTVAFEAIQKSCLWHLKHITQGGDPFEHLEARPLDFGHWSAHKLEALSHYRVRHGEAVGMGVAIDSLYSARVFGFPQEDAHRVCQCLSDLGMPLWDDALEDPTPLLDGLEEFRQHLGGRLTVTMLEAIGRPIDVHEINTEEMRYAIKSLKSFSERASNR